MEIIINGERIEQSVFDQEIRRLKMSEPALSEKKAKERAVEQLTQRVLLTQEAEKRITNVPPREINEEFTRLIAQHGGAKAFYSRYNLSAKDEPMVKQDLARQIKVERLFDDITKTVDKPDDTELKEIYDKAPESFVAAEMVKAAHIVKNPDPQNPEATYGEMVEIRKKLLEGADFAATADEYSGCDDRGGDLGLFGKGKMVDEFETVVFSMSPGEISPVFKTQFGLHVAKVFERRPAAQKSFEEAKEEIYVNLLGSRRESAISSWVKEQKKNAQIVVKD